MTRRPLCVVCGEREQAFDTGWPLCKACDDAYEEQPRPITWTEIIAWSASRARRFERRRKKKGK